jgi:hypothetical protein
LGSNKDDAEAILSHPFVLEGGYEKKMFMEKQVKEEFFPLSGVQAQSETISDSNISEPISELFPPISKSEWQKKLEIDNTKS